MDVLHAGGWVMYPLVGLSVVACALCFERWWFWFGHRSGPCRRYERSIVALVRKGAWSEAIALAGDGPAVLVALTERLLGIGDVGEKGIGQGDVLVEIESLRSAVERFSGVLSVTITAAPMLGILGTVSGIIRSFQLLGSEGPMTDPVAVAGGISEALITTAVGLGIAIVVLVPYVVFRGRADRFLGELEAYGLLISELSQPNQRG